MDIRSARVVGLRGINCQTYDKSSFSPESEKRTRGYLQQELGTGVFTPFPRIKKLNASFSCNQHKSFPKNTPETRAGCLRQKEFFSAAF